MSEGKEKNGSPRNDVSALIIASMKRSTEFTNCEYETWAERISERGRGGGRGEEGREKRSKDDIVRGSESSGEQQRLDHERSSGILSLSAITQ